MSTPNVQTPELQTDGSADEAGFGLVELIIVLVILSILMAVTISLFGGSKQTAATKGAIAAGGSYSQALSQYKVDYAGRLPVVGSANWPDLADGPVDTRLGARKYLGPSQRPENVISTGTPAGNQTFFQNLGSAPPAASPRKGPVLIYRPAAGDKYRLEVWARKREKDPYTMVCWYGDDPATTANAC